MIIDKNKVKIAFQGMPGAYSNMASDECFPNGTTIPCVSFEDMLDATKKGKTDYSMVPVENSVAGRVADIHNLIPESGLFIVAEHFQKVNHQLLGIPGTNIEKNVKIGNFVEIKKSKLKNNTKVSHLSYIGDTQIGKNVNIGAGTITCNYDGVKKNKTKIKDNVFIGSNTSLVAPITINEKSVVGAGSVITKSVRKKSLALTRSSQVEINNYKRKK